MIDSGFRSDRAAEHPAWVKALGTLEAEDAAAASAAPHPHHDRTTEGTAR